MTPEETELWIELMEKGLAIQHAVLESKVVLDQAAQRAADGRYQPAVLPPDPVPDAAAGAGGRGGTIPE